MRKWAQKKVRAKIAARIDDALVAVPATATEDRRFRYTAEQLQFLRDGYREMQVQELTEAFNERFGMSQTRGQIKSTLKNHNFTCGRKKGSPKGTFRVLTQEQAAFVKEHYQRLILPELTIELNRRFGSKFTEQQLRSFTRNHRIRSGRTGKFEPGQQSWNKGKKGYMGANVTSFKKGDIPHTKRRLWSERINRDGFVEISIPERNPYTGAPTRFKHKHVWLWECAHGPVPKTHAVAFVDGDKQNCVLENLMLVTRAELLAMNLHGYREMPAGLKPTVLALAKIEARAGFRTRPGRGRRSMRADHVHD